MTDLAQDVCEMAERSIRDSGATKAEGFRVSVTWAPATTSLGMAPAWLLMITMPSRLLGNPPLAAISDPLLCQSVPRPEHISALVGQMLLLLRAQRADQDRQAITSAAASLNGR